MARPNQRHRAFSVGAVLAAGICLAGGLFAWLWWNGEGAPMAIQEVASAAPPDPGQRSALDQHLADPHAVLSRRDLVTFVRVLGSASLADKQGLRSAIAGRRFHVEVPFGCGSALASNPTASARWWYDRKDRAVRLQAAPDLWAMAALGRSSAREIYWITRPHEGGCELATAEPADAAGAPRPRIGLAVLDEPLKAITHWNSYSSAFSASPNEAADLGRALRLSLEGVVERDASQGLTMCSRHPADEVADCAVVARLERVGFVNTANGIVLAQWDAGRRDPPDLSAP